MKKDQHIIKKVTAYKCDKGTMEIKKTVKKYKLNEQPNDYKYWQTKSYTEQLLALELIREEYNSWRYNAEQGFQRVYRVIKRTES